ncbi:unnamed protein product [Durusdinium trenchii]|uniref:Uncharacterized protein n=1 Tax=Durusdinium trenchii TaxID=1381693 RepID=A0ABP0IJR1_9DINO
MQVEGTTLQDLLRRPPADVAQWVVQQAEALSAPGARVQNLEIFQVAGALSTAPVEQKQELMKNAISGFGRLPATQRAEVLRFAVSTAAVAGSSRRGDVDELTRNVGVLVKEAKIDQMPPAEKRQLAQEIQQDAAELVQPQQLIEVVAELKPEERERMTEALIEAKLVPEEHKGVLEEAMRPGGSADKLVAALKMWTLVEEYALAIVALPFLELLLALVFGGLSCDSGLSAWLRADAWFSCLMMGGGWFCHLQMAPVLQAARQDPLALAQRWQQHQDLPVSRRLEQLVPGVEIGAYQLGAVGAAAAVIFLLIGLANTIVGLMELLGTLVMGCAIFVVLVSMFFIAVRCATFVGILAAAKYVLTEMQALGLDGYTSEDPLLHGGAFNRAPLQP